MERPLGRTITVACISFIALLCVMLGIITHIMYKQSLYHRYEAYITDILHYVDRHIDDDDLAKCIDTLERSEKFNALEAFMDGIMEDFDIHYLYIIKPLDTNETKSVMSVISAEDYYNRYVNTVGNLYLGYIIDDEYDVETIEHLLSIMERKNIEFFEETTDWGTDYTGALTLHDSQGNPYAILAVDVDVTDIMRLIRERTAMSSAVIIFLGMMYTFFFLVWSRRTITDPLMRLEKSVAEFVDKSHGQRNVEALQYAAPQIHTKNEVESLANAVTKMTGDMRDYVDDIITEQEKTNQMRELANKDSLTGIRNKTSYDMEIEDMEINLRNGRQPPFGIAMIDLNFLKRINDTYGHERGNYAIKKLCHIVCTIFTHSPVFRIGGDEFVVILQGMDLEQVDDLTAQFQKELETIAANEDLNPWEKVSAAIGMAFFDSETDVNVESVFRRADQKMYECKRQMKATREG